MLVQVEGDLITAIVSGNAPGIEVPSYLEALPTDRMRFDGRIIVDGSTYSEFWIDEDGTKHIAALDPAWQRIKCPFDAALILVGGVWRVDPPGAIARRALAAYAADKRFRVETGGIKVGGQPIRTDRESQALINGAFNLAKEQPDETVIFKGATGFVEIDSASMIAIGLAVAQHVRECFRTEALVSAGIADGTISTKQQIDQADWPEN